MVSHDWPKPLQFKWYLIGEGKGPLSCYIWGRSNSLNFSLPSMQSTNCVGALVTFSGRQRVLLPSSQTRVLCLLKRIKPLSWANLECMYIQNLNYTLYPMFCTWLSHFCLVLQILQLYSKDWETRGIGLKVWTPLSTIKQVIPVTRPLHKQLITLVGSGTSCLLQCKISLLNCKSWSC